jgi:hypothetical protein
MLKLQSASPSSPPRTNKNFLQTYSTQLEQLREYGFTDVNECLEALMACDGNIEHALEFIISNRERNE